MNISTIVVLAVVAVVFVLAIRKFISGGESDCASCGKDCPSHGCPSCNGVEKMLEDIDRADKAAKLAESGADGRG